MEWASIPSLAALRGVEAAVRLGSLLAAARELNVTHAAVAQHVRMLEDYFGRPLLQRKGRGMAPTPEGTTLAAGLGEGFALIAAAVHRLSQTEDRPLRIAMTPTFAESWLMPVIGSFWSAHPETQLELLPSIRLMDMRADSVDLAIRYGRGEWPGTDPEPLASANLVVVTAPGLIDRQDISTPVDLANHRWLLEKGRPEERFWAKEQGLDLDGMRVIEFETLTMLLQAVRGGAGVSAIPEAIVARDLAEGRLVALFREEQSELAYHIVRRPGREPRTLRPFVKWLRQVALVGQRVLP